MARTYRRIPTYWARHPKTTNYRRGEHASVLDLLEEGFPVSNRHRSRGSIKSQIIPDSWSDAPVMSLKEIITEEYGDLWGEWKSVRRRQRYLIGQKTGKRKIRLPKRWLTWGVIVSPKESGSGRDI